MKKPIIIGIAGGTASGKTTLAYEIQKVWKENVIVLSHDFYYKSLSNLTKAEREKRNYDCPEAYETDLLVNDIKALISGETIQRPIYSYTERLREKETVTVNPAPIIIIEGLLVLENEELSKLMDIKIFVNADSDIRLMRLIERDTKERGINIDYIITKYKDTLRPMHEKYIEPCKKKADIIIDTNVNNGDNYLGAIVEKIKEIKNDRSSIIYNRIN